MATWRDVTVELQAAVASLEEGELVHEQSYTLADSMTVIELMDPKMDPAMFAVAPRKNVHLLAYHYQQALIAH